MRGREEEGEAEDYQEKAEAGVGGRDGGAGESAGGGGGGGLG